MTRFLLPVLAAGALSACSVSFDDDGDAVPASGDGAERTFDVEGFTEVSLAGPDAVEIEIGDEFSVRAEGDTEVLDDLEIEISGDRLKIGRESGGILRRSRDGRVRVYVTMPAIEGASVAGSGDMTVVAAVAEDFEASVAGSGNLIIAGIEATDAEFDIAGSGDITAAGTVRELEISIAGSGNVRGNELRAENLEVRIAGSGDVEAHVSDEVDARLMGSGDVTITGGARCRSRAMGSGELRCS